MKVVIEKVDNIRTSNLDNIRQMTKELKLHRVLKHRHVVDLIDICKPKDKSNL